MTNCAIHVTDKVAIVTGGNRGLGKEIARSLAEGGANIVLGGRNQQDLHKAAVEIGREFDRKVVTVCGDLVDPETANKLVATALESFGRLDVIVNNAGINIRGAIDTVSPDDFDQIVAVNLKGPWLLARAAAATFRRQQAGRVINVASTLGIVGMAERSLYCLTKGAMVQMTRALAVEWGPIGVTVNAICPGPFETEMNLSLTSDPEKYQRFANFTAMKRWGRMNEVGPLALYLASDAASYMTGAILPIDGGWVAW